MPSLICPHCNSKVGYSDESVVQIKFDVNGIYYENGFDPVPPDAYWVTLILCPACQEESITFRTSDGKVRIIHPHAATYPCPDYVPKPIADDFREAQLVCEFSPKSAATLCRRCLEGMIRDFFGVDKGVLSQTIEALRGKVDAAVLAELDAVRHFGNISAHMELNADKIVEIEPEEAIVMVELIWTLINEWYVSRYNREQLHKRVTELNADLKQRRASSRA